MLKRFKRMLSRGEKASSKLLFARELGLGLGHIGVVAPLAKEAMDRGYDCTIVSPSGSANSAHFPAGARLLNAPVLAPAPYQSVSYSEYLLNVGFDSREKLGRIIDDWLAIFASERPNAVVADLCPFAILAAKIADIPVLLVGSPFNIPPPEYPQLAFRHWDEEKHDDLLMEVENAALDAINHELSKHGKGSIKAVFEMYGEATVALTSHRGLDHFSRNQTLQPCEYTGSILLASPAQMPAWPSGEAPRVFAYLRKNSPFYAGTMSALVESGCRVLAYIPDFEDVAIANVVVSTKPFDLSVVGKEADVFVSLGNISSVQFFLEQGVPCICFPDTAERALFGASVESSGLGISIPGSRFSPEAARNAMHFWRTSPCLVDSVKKFAQEVTTRYQSSAAKRSIDIIDRILFP